MKTKLCPKCKAKLPTTSFNWKIKNIKLASYCKNCSRTYIRNHYWNNRQYYLDKTQKRNKKIRDETNEYIYEYLLTHPCIDCGEKDILVLEFDHKERSDKKEDISRIIRLVGTKTALIEEIAKCEVRCANCHRRKTIKDSGGWRLNKRP